LLLTLLNQSTMSISCFLGIHYWDHCKCSKCGKTRDNNHDWSKNCEKCAKCGITGPNHHVRIGRRCSVCGADMQDILDASLHKAIKEPNINVIHECISSGANVNSKDSNERSSLHLMAEYLSYDRWGGAAEFLSILDLLISSGADVNAIVKEDIFWHRYATPLLTAAFYHNAKMILRLLHFGANPKIKASNGDSVFKLFLESYNFINNEDFWLVVETIGEGRAWSTTKEGKLYRKTYEAKRSDFFKDAKWNNAEEIKSLVENASLKDLTHLAPQFNAFHEAAHRGYANLIELMLKKGVAVDCRSTTGETALIMALAFGYDNHKLNSEVIRILLENNASIHVNSNDGHNPIALATYLAKHFVDPNARKEAEISLNYLKSKVYK
jgi:ankyrin repeat protein